MMHLSSNWSALPRGIEFNGNALAIAQFKTPSSPAFRATANHRIDALNQYQRIASRYSALFQYNQRAQAQMDTPQNLPTHP
jgi:hypothetical protein